MKHVPGMARMLALIVMILGEVAWAEPSQPGSDTAPLSDTYKKQPLYLHPLYNTQQYDVRDGAYRIRNGKHILNRVLYGTNGPESVFAGDRPVIVLTCYTAKLGALGLQVLSGEQRMWLDQAEQINFTYDGAHVGWEVRDPILGEATLSLRVVALDTGAGYIVRTESTHPVRLRCWYGGLRGDYPDSKAGSGPLPGGRDEADCKGNTVTCDGNTATVADANVETEIGGIKLTGAEVLLGLTAEGAWRAVEAGAGAAAEAEFTVGPEPSHIVVVTQARDPARGMAEKYCLPRIWDAYRKTLDRKPGEMMKEILAAPEAAWQRALEHYEHLATRLTIETPDPILDAAMRGNGAAMDGCYRPPSIMHGAHRWGTNHGQWYVIWRGWYGPIVAGDLERIAGAARMHFAHQTKKPHPQSWLQPGRIADYVSTSGTFPDTSGVNAHDVLIDHLRHYYRWTGDDALVKELWPSIKLALQYARRYTQYMAGRNLGGLYTNNLNTFISDGHKYNMNACTQASAYAVARNRFAAQIAELTGDDADFYRQRAELTLGQMNARLWTPQRGYFAEFVDRDGVLHDALEAPTIYHPIEMGVADAFQAYQMTRYVDERLWQFGDQIRFNDWYPIIPTNNSISFSESLNTALAYYHAGRFERAWRLLKVCVDSTAKAATPGSISCYAGDDGRQGIYIDFSDTTSLLPRTVVEGLYGLEPRLDLGRVEWRPRFPAAWPHARLRTDGGFSLQFKREGNATQYVLESDSPLRHDLFLPAPFAALESVTVNGEAVEPETVDGLLRPYVRVSVPDATRTTVRVVGTGQLPKLIYPRRFGTGRETEGLTGWRYGGPLSGNELVIECEGGRILELHNPQSLFSTIRFYPHKLQAIVKDIRGHHTLFVQVETGVGTYWAPVDIQCVPRLEITQARLAALTDNETVALHVTVRNNMSKPLSSQAEILYAGQTLRTAIDIEAGTSQELALPLERPTQLYPGHNRVVLRAAGHTATSRTRLWRLFDALETRRQEFAKECKLIDFERTDNLPEVFTRQYELAPGRPPVRRYGMLNFWTTYDTGYMNVEAMRKRAEDGVLMTHVGVPFGVTMEGNDGLYLSRYRPLRSSARIATAVRADRLYLLLANHTHNSQSHMKLAEVVLHYADGSTQTVPLTSPHEIDSMLQHYCDMAPVWIGGKDEGWFGHGHASGVHADITDIQVDPARELTAFELRCTARDTVIGLLAATAHTIPSRPAR